MFAGGPAGQLVWIDGTPYGYDNFEDGQPDNVTVKKKTTLSILNVTR